MADMRTDDREARAALEKRLAADHAANTVVSGNGHTMSLAAETFGTGEDRRTHYAITVRDDSTGRIVAYSLTERPDPEAERQFTLDYLVGEIR